jgi:hypothetical protein
MPGGFPHIFVNAAIFIGVLETMLAGRWTCVQVQHFNRHPTVSSG